MANNIPADSRVVVEQVNSANHATRAAARSRSSASAAALFVLVGASGLALALDRLIPRRRPQAARVAAPAVPGRAGARAAPEGDTPAEPEMPALEVPTMTLGARVEDG